MLAELVATSQAVGPTRLGSNFRDMEHQNTSFGTKLHLFSNQLGHTKMCNGMWGLVIPYIDLGCRLYIEQKQDIHEFL